MVTKIISIKPKCERHTDAHLTNNSTNEEAIHSFTKNNEQVKELHKPQTNIENIKITKCSEAFIDLVVDENQKYNSNSHYKAKRSILMNYPGHLETNALSKTATIRFNIDNKDIKIQINRQHNLLFTSHGKTRKIPSKNCVISILFDCYREARTDRWNISSCVWETDRPCVLKCKQNKTTFFYDVLSVFLKKDMDDYHFCSWINHQFTNIVVKKTTKVYDFNGHVIDNTSKKGKLFFLQLMKNGNKIDHCISVIYAIRLNYSIKNNFIRQHSQDNLAIVLNSIKSITADVEHTATKIKENIFSKKLELSHEKHCKILPDSTELSSDLNINTIPATNTSKKTISLCATNDKSEMIDKTQSDSKVVKNNRSIKMNDCSSTMEQSQDILDMHNNHFMKNSDQCTEKLTSTSLSINEDIKVKHEQVKNNIVPIINDSIGLKCNFNNKTKKRKNRLKKDKMFNNANYNTEIETQLKLKDEKQNVLQASSKVKNIFKTNNAEKMTDSKDRHSGLTQITSKEKNAFNAENTKIITDLKDRSNVPSKETSKEENAFNADNTKIKTDLRDRNNGPSKETSKEENAFNANNTKIKTDLRDRNNGPSKETSKEENTFNADNTKIKTDLNDRSNSETQITSKEENALNKNNTEIKTNLKYNTKDLLQGGSKEENAFNINNTKIKTDLKDIKNNVLQTNLKEDVFSTINTKRRSNLKNRRDNEKVTSLEADNVFGTKIESNLKDGKPNALQTSAKEENVLIACHNKEKRTNFKDKNKYLSHTSSEEHGLLSTKMNTNLRNRKKDKSNFYLSEKNVFNKSDDSELKTDLKYRRNNALYSFSKEATLFKTNHTYKNIADTTKCESSKKKTIFPSENKTSVSNSGCQRQVFTEQINTGLLTTSGENEKTSSKSSVCLDNKNVIPPCNKLMPFPKIKVRPNFKNTVKHSSEKTSTFNTHSHYKNYSGSNITNSPTEKDEVSCKPKIERSVKINDRLCTETYNRRSLTKQELNFISKFQSTPKSNEAVSTKNDSSELININITLKISVNDITKSPSSIAKVGFTNDLKSTTQESNKENKIKFNTLLESNMRNLNNKIVSPTDAVNETSEEVNKHTTKTSDEMIKNNNCLDINQTHTPKEEKLFKNRNYVLSDIDKILNSFESSKTAKYLLQNHHASLSEKHEETYKMIFYGKNKKIKYFERCQVLHNTYSTVIVKFKKFPIIVHKSDIYLDNNDHDIEKMACDISLLIGEILNGIYVEVNRQINVPKYNISTTYVALLAWSGVQVPEKHEEIPLNWKERRCKVFETKINELCCTDCSFDIVKSCTVVEIERNVIKVKLEDEGSPGQENALLEFSSSDVYLFGVCLDGLPLDHVLKLGDQVQCENISCIRKLYIGDKIYSSPKRQYELAESWCRRHQVLKSVIPKLLYRIDFVPDSLKPSSIPNDCEEIVIF